MKFKMKIRKIAGSLLNSLHLLHAGRYVYRKLTGRWKDLIWFISHRGEPAPDGLPYPPPHLCFSVAASYDPYHFFSSGEIGAASILDILRKNGKEISGFEAILDFGCGCGRIARHWRNLNKVEIFGTDINPELIKWSRKNLAFTRFSKIGQDSSLDYTDNRFDFIYAVAVFGHFREEFQEYWMNELRRVLKPGGLLLITTKGESRIGELTEKDAERFRSGNIVVIEPECSGANYCLVYHPYSYILNTLAGDMEILYYEPSGSPDTSQDLYLLISSSVH